MDLKLKIMEKLTADEFYKEYGDRLDTDPEAFKSDLNALLREVVEKQREDCANRFHGRRNTFNRIMLTPLVTDKWLSEKEEK